MRDLTRLRILVIVVFAGTLLLSCSFLHKPDQHLQSSGGVTVNPSVRFDRSRPLGSVTNVSAALESNACDEDRSCGTSPEAEANDPQGQQNQPDPGQEPDAHKSAPDAGVEQNKQGNRPPAAMIDSFDGLGFGFIGPQGAAAGRNPSDNTLAVGPDHIVQIVNSRLAVFTKKGNKYDSTGKVLYGPVVTNSIFAGFGGQCEHQTSGDSVVRYDQLANRWLYVLPIFRRPPDDPKGAYSMCYAVSTGPDPLGPYYRYEFKRALFPDYPRPALWPDGYYLPTSTGDTVIQKHACVADRTKMLQGLPATEQCVIVDGVNFLNNADLDGQFLPPPGAPNIVMAAGGTQLHKQYEDDGIYAYKFHVDWNNPSKTKLSEALKIKVAPYHYLCNGQLTSCVPQPETTRRLDAQGDKLMQRLVYRNFGNHQSIVALHSINSNTGGGGVRWYEFRLDENGSPSMYQQGTYAPDRFYRWMPSMAMDRNGDIGIGYSFGGTPHYAGQRFAARLQSDPLGQLTFHETVLVEGAASQKNTLRWEDYATTAMDPSDDCTFWYVGDYLKAGAASYTSRIGSFRLPGCLVANVSGAVYFDSNHNGRRDPGELGLSGVRVSYNGQETANLSSDATGRFSVSLPADPVYGNPSYSFSLSLPDRRAGWISTTKSPAGSMPGIAFANFGYRVRLTDARAVDSLDFGEVCVAKSQGGRDVKFWSGGGRGLLSSHTGEWQELINLKLHLVNDDGSRFAVSTANGGFDQLRAWLRVSSSRNESHRLSQQLAAVAFNTSVGKQDGSATAEDPVAGDWATVHEVVNRVSSLIAAHPNASAADSSGRDMLKYEALFRKLNKNSAMITPDAPSACKTRF